MFKGLGGLGDMAGMMKKAQEMQSKMGEMQDALADITVEGESGAGLVRATATAKGDLTALDIDPSIFIGAPLLSNEEKYELTKAPRFQFEATDYLVIGDGDVKDTESWSAADTAACEASGGEVLPLPAGRNMCFRF